MEHISTGGSFLDEYDKKIRPLLEEIDLFLKIEEEPFNPKQVADLLFLDEGEVEIIAGPRALIDKDIFMYIMSKGSSWICRMYQRELEVKSPPTYKGGELAYIYDLDADMVEAACKELKIKEVTAFTMPLVFARVPGYLC